MRTGICPACNGNLRMAVPEHSQRYKNVMAGYDKATDTLPCNNCGGQYQYGRPTGKVSQNKDGLPCKHNYLVENAGRCLYKYTCWHCEDTYKIDSGD